MSEENNKSNTELRPEELAYILGHDFREPLRMASSYSQLISKRLQKNEDQDIQDYLFYLKDGVQRMDLMVQALAEYLRLEKDDTRIAEVQVGKLLLSLQQTTLRGLITQTQANIKYNGTATLPGQNDHIKRIFSELLKNALQYRQPEQITKILIREQEQEEYWQFEICDNGLGFPTDDIDRLFSLFKKHQFPGIQQEGVGVGLALCQRILSLYGGKITVKADPNWSTCIIFTFPKT